MTVPLPTGMDYLGVRLHARRSRMAEAARLDALCRLRSIPELAHELFPDVSHASAIELQRRMVLEHVKELADLARYLDGAQGRMAEWVSFRYQVENLKVLARGFATHMPLEDVRPHLVAIPGQPWTDETAMLDADTAETFAALLPVKPLRLAVQAVAETYHAQPRSFFIEAALDRGYFTELLARTAALSDDDREEVFPLVRQEVDFYHLMLAARGKFIYGLKSETILPLHVAGAGIRRDRLAAMLAASDLAEAAGPAVGLAIDALPQELRGAAGASSADPIALETAAMNRTLRLANTVFRRSHIGMGAVVAFAALRRVELANLITLSEGIRLGLEPEALRRRLIPRSDGPSASKVG